MRPAQPYPLQAIKVVYRNEFTDQDMATNPEKRRPRLWIAIAVMAGLALAVWMIVGEMVWRTPNKGNPSHNTVVQPSEVPPPGPSASPTRPGNSD